MKKIKKIASIILAAVMVLAMTVPAMAATLETTTKTVNVSLPDAASILKEHTFTAYQVFKGTQGAKDKVIGDVQWGNDIDVSKFVSALKNLDVSTEEGKEEKPFAGLNDTATAKEVVDILVSLGDHSAKLEKVAQTAYNCITEGAAGTSLTKEVTQLESGYYLIVDSSPANMDVYNAALLQATTDVDIEVKTDKPEIEKKIDGSKDDDGDTTGLVDYDKVPIGKNVPYQLKSKVPDMSHFIDYKFVMSDLMSQGLTYDEDINITIGGKKLEKDKEYTVTFTSVNELGDNAAKYGLDLAGKDKEYAGGTYIRIVFNNFYENYKDQQGDEIVVTYSATVNKNAVVGAVGNPNKVRLEYSSKPNEVGEGDENDFDETEPKGITPWDQVRTFETALELTKIDGKTEKALTGARFEIAGKKLKGVLATKEVFTADNEKGTYWKLKDGTYTQDDPNTPGMDKSLYESTETRYSAEITKDVVEDATDVLLTVEVGGDGKILVTGLADGTYVFTEIKAPDGYNLLDTPIVVVVTSNLKDLKDEDGNEHIEWSGKYGKSNADKTGIEGDGTDLTFNGAIGGFSFTIENNEGSVLPETGGIGTTIFYVIGAILVVGAGVVLVTRKRVNK